MNIPAMFSESGKRERHFFKTRELALDAAAKMREARDTFGSNAVAIAPSLAEQATAAARMLEPLGIGLLEAVSRYVASEKQRLASKPIAEAVAAFRSQGASKWSESQSKAYRLCGEKLETAFPERLISDITGEELAKHLNDITSGPGAFNQSVRLVRAIWRWCAKAPRQWCDPTTVDQLEAKETVAAETETLTATEARRLLDTAAKYFPDTVPAYAIALFSGLRQAEIERLRPCDISKRGISVAASSSKTKKRRFIKMVEPLADWLEAYPAADHVCPPNWERKDRAVRRLAGWAVWSDIVPSIDKKQKAAPPTTLPAWPANALRHTAATVAVALGKPLEALIFEHGHSGGVAMLKQHYLGHMPPDEAAEIWAIRPNGKTAPKIKIA